MKREKVTQKRTEDVVGIGMDYLFNEKGRPYKIKDIQTEAKKHVSSTFKSTRKELGVTQKKLERLTGVAQPNITRFESEICNPTLEMMVKIAAALNMKLEISLTPLDKTASTKKK